MSENPRVSVIIPTYNGAHLIGRAIQSVLNQTYQDFEIIVVDDASTDNTEELVKSFNDGRIQYNRHEKTKGAAAARNTGIKFARGDYIAFQDSDDEWLPEKLEKQIKVFGNTSSKVGVVYTGFWRIENDTKTYIPSSRITQKEGSIHWSLLETNFIGTPAAMVKKECLLRAGTFDERLPRLQDWELWIRISKYYCFKCIDEPLVIAYYQPGRISSDRSALIKASKLLLGKHFLDIRRNRRLLAKHYFRIAGLLQSNGEFEQARQYLTKCAMAYPLNITYLGAAAASLLGESGYKKMAALYRSIRGRFSRTP